MNSCLVCCLRRIFSCVFCVFLSVKFPLFIKKVREARIISVTDRSDWDG